MGRGRICVSVLLLCLAFAGCDGPVSSLRETDVVQVVRDNAASVVNIRTESLVDLKEHPAGGSTVSGRTGSSNSTSARTTPGGR